jgi:hypothetical protein
VKRGMVLTRGSRSTKLGPNDSNNIKYSVV